MTKFDDIEEYKNYLKGLSKKDLLQIENSIDQEKYPERFTLVNNAILKIRKSESIKKEQLAKKRTEADSKRAWKLKDKKTIENDLKKRYRHPSAPLFFATMAFILGSIYAKFGIRRYYFESPGAITYNPISWTEFFQNRLFFIVVVSIIVFLCTYAWQCFKKKPFLEGPKAMICKKCNQVKNQDDSPFCECGGELIELYKMEWVEKK
nr:hypothetical protein [uncultured Desulfobacter sp.]